MFCTIAKPTLPRLSAFTLVSALSTLACVHLVGLQSANKHKEEQANTCIAVVFLWIPFNFSCNTPVFFCNCFARKIFTYSASLPVFCFSSWGHLSSGVTLHSESVSGLIKVEGSGGLLPGSRPLLRDPIFPLYLTNPETLQLVYFMTFLFFMTMTVKLVLYW